MCDKQRSNQHTLARNKDNVPAGKSEEENMKKVIFLHP